MALDRRKHDVDIIERVLGGIRDSGPPEVNARVIDVDVPDVPWSGGTVHRTMELTIRIDDKASNPRRRR